MRRIETYARPATPEEAVAAFLAAGEGARFIAGGTSLYDMMKLDIDGPRHLVDVTEIKGLQEIETDGGVLRFGALATMRDVATDPVVEHDYPVLSESLWKAASQQLRNMATVGGNLLQRTRCMYFRNGTGGSSNVGVYPCNKRKAGSGCPAIGGLDRTLAVLGVSNACIAVSPGDWPVALMAMDASVELLGPDGARTVPIAELYRLPGNTPNLEFTLKPGEIITAITVPAAPWARASTYHKIRDRESYAFALVSAAVALDMDGDTVREARVALGGVATVPWRAPEAEATLTGATLSADTALAAGRAAFAGATPGEHNAFKVELGARAVADAIQIAAERNR